MTKNTRKHAVAASVVACISMATQAQESILWGTGYEIDGSSTIDLGTHGSIDITFNTGSAAQVLQSLSFPWISEVEPTDGVPGLANESIGSNSIFQLTLDFTNYLGDQEDFRLLLYSIFGNDHFGGTDIVFRDLSPSDVVLIEEENPGAGVFVNDPNDVILDTIEVVAAPNDGSYLFNVPPSGVLTIDFIPGATPSADSIGIALGSIGAVPALPTTAVILAGACVLLPRRR